ncbi:U-scoloptoxin(01)-Cw1a-like [Penaeus monodon]|uniref:U-scoloptoxin(01)-Cw1a-like n=1 Tax=Penaeus monodon TaxID=6687 RepID=UPI0018A78A17|nr:U-scoloptoxin(01)-Cw1a-like [Penaeus monodon]XP_047493367.1 U-scoloptoxin(01)-Cw1a-like [Penaeus chinensis]
MKAVFVLALCIATAAARSAYQLPSGVELLRSQVITSFSCAGRPYGYFADVANDCAIFHVCYPVNDELGNIIEEAQFSFLCGNQTVFSQESLTCAHPEEAFPCDQAETLYDLSNADFGKIPEEF